MDMFSGGIFGNVNSDCVYKNEADAQDAIRKFLAMPFPDFKVGDFVEPNDLGKTRYKTMKAAAIAELFPFRPNGEKSAHLVNARLCVAHDDGDFTFPEVDTRFYRLAKEKKKIFSIRGGRS